MKALVTVKMVRANSGRKEAASPACSIFFFFFAIFL